MGSQPDISIITSLYRSERYLRRYSRAVVEVAEELKTGGMLLELVIVANDATSREKKAIDGLTSRLQSAGLAQVVVLHVDRELLYASWNRGVRASSAECLGFWNVDDLRNAAALREGLAYVKSGGELMYYPVVEVSLRKEYGLFRGIDVKYPVAPEFDRYVFTREMHVGPFFLFSRSLYRRVGPFDEQFRIVGDYDWAIRAARVTDFRLGRCVGGAFLHDGNGISARGNPRHPAENNIVYLRHGAYDKIAPADADLMRQYRVALGDEPVDVPPQYRAMLFDRENDSVDPWDIAWERRRRVRRWTAASVSLPRRGLRFVLRQLGVLRAAP